ncbi:hypothetical protein [Phenylobacterium sp.]|uniref:hypothetical protein n=1 Tax=Phenylobacterium sp. TaxID=1871053 RepID=UPI002FC8E31C
MPQIGETRTRKDGLAKATWDGSNWVEMEIGGLQGGADHSVESAAPGAAFFGAASSRPKMFAKTEQELMSLDGDAKTAQSLRADANRFRDLNRQVPTGELGGLPVVRDVRAMFDPKVGEMKAIVEKMTPSMREAGSGAMSDRDVQMYRASVVGLDKVGPTNSALSGVIEAGARRTSDYTAFKNEWARRHNTLVGSQEAWDDYAEANPLFEAGETGTKVRKATPWRQYFGLETLSTRPTAPAGPRKPALPPAVRAAYAIQQAKAKGASGPLGTEANPFVARDQATFDQLANDPKHRGKFIYAPNGDFGVIE